MPPVAKGSEADIIAVCAAPAIPVAIDKGTLGKAAVTATAVLIMLSEIAIPFLTFAALRSERILFSSSCRIFPLLY